MAESVTLKTSGSSATDGLAFTSASYTPTASRLLIAIYTPLRDSADPTAPTLAGNGLTWSQIDGYLWNTNTQIHAGGWMFAANTGLAPTTGSLVFSHGVTTHHGAAWVIFEVDGSDLPNAASLADLFTQVVDGPVNDGNASEVAITLAAAAHANNRPFQWAAKFGDITMTPESTWTEIAETPYISSPPLMLGVQWKSDGFDTSTLYDWTGLVRRGGQAFEIKALVEVQIVSPGIIANAPTLFTPAIVQTVAPGLITNAPVVFAPEVETRVALSLLTNPPTIFALTISQSVQLSLIAQTPVVFDPAVVPVQIVATGLIVNSPTLFDPTLRQSVALGLIANPSVVYAPEVDQSVALGLIANPPTLFGLEVEQTVAVGLIATTPTLFTPKVKALSRPISTITTGLWLTNAAGIDLHNAIDELSVPNDADFIQSPLVVSGAALAEVELRDVGDPISALDHVVVYRYQKNAAGGQQIDLVVRLMQGAATVASWTHTNIATGFTTALQTLTEAQANSITDYGGLSLQFESVATLEAVATRRAIVSWSQFTLPPGQVVAALLEVPLIANPSTVFAAVVLSAQIVELSTVTNPPVVHEPVLLSAQIQAVGLITNAPTIYEPTIKQGQEVTVGLIANPPTLFAPTAQQVSAPALISNPPVVFGPSISQTVQFPIIAKPPSVFAPVVDIRPEIALDVGECSLGWSLGRARTKWATAEARLRWNVQACRT